MCYLYTPCCAVGAEHMCAESTETFLLREDISPKGLLSLVALPGPCVCEGQLDAAVGSLCQLWGLPSSPRAVLFSGNQSYFAPGKIHCKEQHMGHWSVICFDPHCFFPRECGVFPSTCNWDWVSCVLVFFQKRDLQYSLSFPNHLTVTVPWPVTILFY